ncbi:MAG: histidinol-phosphate aminotransferase family protein [Candidatus Nitrosocaldus sp.]|nr:histidinol-phosphate aminotransferase family protein [Candidatus Nitrosocaldus sp.]MDW7999731.1 histidinol-phosphate transaminase [Candidatus Nitrosocaldus sp.]
MELDGLVKAGILALKPVIHGGRHYMQCPNAIDFSTSVNPFGPSPRVKEVIVKSIDTIGEYPDAHARRFTKVAAEYIGVDDSCIVAGNGSVELIYLVADALISRGDGVIIVEPTFSEYERASTKNSATVEHVMPDDLTCMLSARHISMLYEKMREGAKLIFICNPNNPTGSVVEREVLLHMVEEAYDRGAMVLLDECFMEFSSIDCSLARYAGEFSNLIVLRSLTKAFGLAGLRVGYCITNPRLAGVLADVKVPWSVNVLAEVAGVEALRDMEYVERCRTILAGEREYMQNRLKGMGYHPLRSSVNFFMVEVPEGVHSTALRDGLLRRGMLVRDCSNFFGLEGGRYVRISPRLRAENDVLMDAMEDVLRDGL